MKPNNPSFKTKSSGQGFGGDQDGKAAKIQDFSTKRNLTATSKNVLCGEFWDDSMYFRIQDDLSEDTHAHNTGGFDEKSGIQVGENINIQESFSNKRKWRAESDEREIQIMTRNKQGRYEFVGSTEGRFGTCRKLASTHSLEISPTNIVLRRYFVIKVLHQQHQSS
jgi:hypothetical protein